MKYVKLDKTSIQDCGLNEAWVQDRIAEDPALLGLGNLELRDKERRQPGAGRLDLLLSDPESAARYEVEIQLGRTDPSHIIRTLEYWEIERKRYPQYEHTAVIVAEDVTTRFLNVMHLFNGAIPLVAIQMTALKVDDGVSLMFTTVLDQVSLGLVDEDEVVQETTNRAWWEAKATKATVAMADEMLNLVQASNPGAELNYNKQYIGLTENGRANNYVILKPKKRALNVEFRLARSDELDSRIEQSGLDLIRYDKRWSRYALRIPMGELAQEDQLLREFSAQALKEFGS